MPETQNNPGPAPRPSALRGAAMAVVLAWTMRAVGLVSVFIMARLLTPEDFGIVGLAIVAVSFIEIFSYLGLRQTLLRIEDPDRSYLDTAWTMQFGILTLLGVILAVLSPAIAAFYGLPELVPVLCVLAIRSAMAGAINIGIVDFDRHFQFGRDLGMRLFAKLASLAATVTAALLLQSYWALVIGLLVQSSAQTAASYVLHPYRPRFSLQRRAELVGVSLWMFLGTAAQIVHNQIDRAALGRVAEPDAVGAFTVSKDLSAIFTEEIATALNRVAFVQTSRSGALETQGALIGPLLGAYALVTAPLGIGLAAVADEFFLVFLGDQWDFAAKLALWLAPAGAVYAVYRLIASSLQAGGMARLSAIVSWVGTAITFAAILAAIFLLNGTPSQIAGASLTSCIATLAIGSAIIGRYARTDVVGLTIHMARPFLAAVAMFVALQALTIWPQSALLALFAKAFVGAVIYVCIAALLWWATGRPQSAEARVIALVRSQVNRLKEGRKGWLPELDSNQRPSD